MRINKLSSWTVLILWSINRWLLRDTKFHHKRLKFLSCVRLLFHCGYISKKYVPLENTCEYQFSSKYFTCPSMVSVAHMTVRLLIWNTMSALYCLDRGITAERVSLGFVLAIVSLACLRPICHRSLSSSGDAVEWRLFDWNLLACGASCTVVFVSDTFLDGIKATLTLPIIQLVMAPMS